MAHKTPYLKAEELESTRLDLQSALSDAVRAIQDVSNVSPLSDDVDLCENCYEEQFGWGDDDG